MTLIIDAIEMLESYGFKETDILWVGNDKNQCSWEQFKLLVDGKLKSDELHPGICIFGKDFVLRTPCLCSIETWELTILYIRPQKELVFDDLINWHYQNRVKYEAQREKINARNRALRLAKKVEKK